MTCRLLQLNIQKGSHLDAVIRYINRHNFDIVCLQEVAGGRIGVGNVNCYEEILKRTHLRGNLAPYISITGDVSSFIGNATFYKHTWIPKTVHVIWLKKHQELADPSGIDARRVSRCALATFFQKNNHELLVINTHLAWGPTPNDTLYKKNQAEKLYQWIRKQRRIPFILTGDFNLNPHTVIVSRLSRLGRNLTTQYKVTNTLNPRLHRLKMLFPSGLVVDYVIADKRFHIKKFFVEEADLSDHFGLITEFSL